MNPWAFVAELGVTVGLWAINDWLNSTPDTRAKYLQEQPMANEGSPVNIVIGRQRVRSPLFAWYGGFTSLGAIDWGGISQPDGTVSYGLNMLFALGVPMGPSQPGSSTFATLTGMWVGDTFLSLSLTNGQTQRTSTFATNYGPPGELPNSLGATGCTGLVSFFAGGNDQQISNNAPSAPSDHDTFTDLTEVAWFMRRAYIDGSGPDPTTIPGYRGQMLVGLTGAHDWFITGNELNQLGLGPPGAFWDAFYFGPDPHVPQVSFEVASYRNRYISGWSPTWQDNDPASALYDILTEPWNKVGILDPTTIDDASFGAASATLFTEGNGYSRVIDTLRDAREVLQEIVNQICGALYMDPVTGKVHLKLIRNDYSIPSILALTASDVVSIDDNTVGSWRNVANQVRVRYPDRSLQYNDATAVAQNMASAVMGSSSEGDVQSPGGNVRSVTVSYPGCCTYALAQQLAERDLALLSTPLQQIRATFSRRAAVLRPGDVFKLTFQDYPSLAAGVVFRVTQVDLGQLGDGKVSVTAMQDVFSVGQAVGMPVAPITTASLSIPSPIARRKVVETPRWMLQWGANGGAYPNADAARLTMLAAPDDNSKTYAGKSVATFFATTFGAGLTTDVVATTTPVHGLVHASYDRSVGPYDTTVGLLVDSLPAVTATLLTTQVWSHDQIAVTGYPLVLVGDEIMAYESVTDTSGTGVGPWRLNNVWRAGLDTAAHDHAVGEDVWWIGTAFQSLNWIGTQSRNVAIVSQDALTTQVAAQRGVIVGSGQDVQDAVTLVGRSQFSPRVANLRLCGEVMTGVQLQPVDNTQPASMTGYYGKVTAAEEGVGFNFTPRDRLSTTIARGDEAAQTPSDAVTYSVSATKVAAQTGEAAGSEVTLLTGLVAGDPSNELLVGGAGYGDVDLAVHTVVTSTGSQEWDAPKVRCRFERWRNLLGNVRFAINGAGTNVAPCWTRVNATVSASSSSIYGSAGGCYVSGSVNGATLTQIVDVSGYLPRAMDAWLDFYAISLVSTDKVVAKVEALDASSASLANTSVTITPTASTTWSLSSVVLSAMPANTAKVRVTFTFGGLQTVPTCFVCEPRLRVGTFQRNVLANPSFEATLTSWTTTAGAMTTTTAGAHPSAHFATGNNPGTAGTSTIVQDYSVPTGWEYGSDAVLTCWRCNTAARPADTGRVTLIALSAGGATLGSIDTGFETFSTWTQRRLSLQLPEGTSKVRVQFDGTDPGGGTSGGYCLDEVVLSLAKDLSDARLYKEVLLNAPSLQSVAQTWQQWHIDNVALYRAGVQHPIVLGGGKTQASIDAITTRTLTMAYTDGVARSAGVGVGQWGGGVASVPTYVFTRGGPCMTSVGDDVRTRRLAPTVANGFTAIVVFRVDEDAFAGACGLCGRRDIESGWSLGINAGGHVTAVVTGPGGTASVSCAAVVTDGGWHCAAIVYNPTAATLTVVDDSGVNTTALGAIGDIANTDAATTFLLGKGTALDDTLPGMIEAAYFFETQALTTAHVQAQWNYGKDPSGLLSDYGRNEVAWCGGLPDSSGSETVTCMSAQQVAIGYAPALVVYDTASKMGIATCPSGVTNLVTSWDFTNSSAWVAEAGATVTVGEVDATGRPLGAHVAATAGAGVKALALAATSSATITVVFWAKAASSTFINVVLLNGSDVVKGTIAQGLSTTWKRYVVTFSTWDNSTPGNARIAFRNATFDLSHVTHVQSGTDVSSLIPKPGTSFSADVTCDVVGSLPLQLNAEGEIVVEGVSAGAATPPTSSIASIDDGGITHKDMRELLVDGTAGARFDHYDGAAVGVSSTTTAISWTSAFQLRGRWCSLSTLDNAATPFAGLRVTTGVSHVNAYGRVATWTYDSTRPARIQLGVGTQHAFSGFVRRLLVRAREEKLI